MSYLGIVLANLWRKPLRTLFTGASLLVAFLLFGILHSVSRAFESGIELAGATRLMVTPKNSVLDSLPLAHMEHIRQLEGVRRISPQAWFGGIYKDPKNVFAQWAVLPKPFMSIHDEWLLAPDQLEAFATTKTGVIVGRETAHRFGLSLGDKIPLMAGIWQNRNLAPWEFQLVGIFDGADHSVDTTALFLNFEFFDEYRAYSNGTTGYYAVSIDDARSAKRTADAIDALFSNSSAETETLSEKEYRQQWVKQIGDIGLIATGILSVVFFTILLLTGTAMFQSVRERVPELAVLKTLGFQKVQVALLVITESLLLTVTACLLGLGIAALVMPILRERLSAFVGSLSFSADIAALGIAIAIALGAVVGFIPAMWAMRLKIVDALAGR